MEWLNYLVIQNNGDGILVNGNLQGSHYKWYENGRLKSISFYVDGILDGIQRAWYE